MNVMLMQNNRGLHSSANCCCMKQWKGQIAIPTSPKPLNWFVDIAPYLGSNQKNNRRK